MENPALISGLVAAKSTPSAILDPAERFTIWKSSLSLLHPFENVRSAKRHLIITVVPGFQTHARLLQILFHVKLPWPREWG